jgi:hypothetical protein
MRMSVCVLRFALCTPCTVRFLLSALHSHLASPSLTSSHLASPRFASLAACCPRKKQFMSNTTPPPYHWNTIAKAQPSRRCESGAWSIRQAQSIEIMHLLASQLSKGCCATPIVPSLRRSASNTLPNAAALTCIVYAIEPSRAPCACHLDLNISTRQITHAYRRLPELQHTTCFILVNNNSGDRIVMCLRVIANQAEPP